jgi:predicted metal-dependent hydrolase
LSETTRRELILDGIPVGYELRRSVRRRRTIEISVDPAGVVHVAAPIRIAQRSIDEFVVQRSGWIRRQLAVQAARTARPTPEYVTGDCVPFLGQKLALRVQLSLPGTESLARRVKGGLEVSLPDPRSNVGDHIVGALERWYRAAAADEIERRVARYGPAAGAAPSAILIRSQKHLWGSCSSDGVLRFNWRLIMAPSEVVDYVVVHELCHLQHPHHQRPFWDAVAAIMPDFRARRAALRREGDSYRL